MTKANFANFGGSRYGGGGVSGDGKNPKFDGRNPKFSPKANFFFRGVFAEGEKFGYGGGVSGDGKNPKLPWSISKVFD